MCFSSTPSYTPPPAAPPPPPAQVEKAPMVQSQAAAAAPAGQGASTAYGGKSVRGKPAGGRITGGSLLTGPAGIDNALLSTGKTLLGQ